MEGWDDALTRSRPLASKVLARPTRWKPCQEAAAEGLDLPTLIAFGCSWPESSGRRASEGKFRASLRKKAAWLPEVTTQSAQSAKGTRPVISVVGTRHLKPSPPDQTPLILCTYITTQRGSVGEADPLTPDGTALFLESSRPGSAPAGPGTGLQHRGDETRRAAWRSCGESLSPHNAQITGQHSAQVPDLDQHRKFGRWIWLSWR